MFQGSNRNPYRKARALTDCAFHRHHATVQVHQQLDQGQPQTGALEFPCETAVDLAEWLEELFEPLARDPDPLVGDADSEEFRPLAFDQRERSMRPRMREYADIAARYPLGLEYDLATVGGELDRVRQQVVDDLLHLARVGIYEAETVRGAHLEPNVSCRRLSLDDREAVPQQRGDVYRIEIEQHLPRFHLREVEDVVDE